MQACVSPFFLQRGFSLMTGVGIGEYLRSNPRGVLDVRRGGYGFVHRKFLNAALAQCTSAVAAEKIREVIDNPDGIFPPPVKGGGEKVVASGEAAAKAILDFMERKGLVKHG